MSRSSMHKTHQRNNKVWAARRNSNSSNTVIISNVDEAISPNFAEPRCSSNSKILSEKSSSLATMYRLKQQVSAPPRHSPRKSKTYTPQLADIDSIRESTNAAATEDAWEAALPLLDYQTSSSLLPTLFCSSSSSSMTLPSPSSPRPESVLLAAAAAATASSSSLPSLPFSSTQQFELPPHPLDPPSSNTPRPSPSTRLKNAFRRLSMQEVVPSRSSSLAEKIKGKFQPKPASTAAAAGMKRSTSLSSISSSWSSRFSPNKSTNRKSSTGSSSNATVSPLESDMQVHESLSLDNKAQRQHQQQPNIIMSDRRPSVVRFAPLVSIKETFSRHEYDRGCDPDAACTRLTSAMVQRIKDELNFYKLQEMHVHEQSRVYTHFFL